MRELALRVHLGLLPVGRRRQGDHPEDAGADALGDRLDGPALPRPVPALEDDDDLQALVLDPFLELAELGLELEELLSVLLPAQLRFFCRSTPGGLGHEEALGPTPGRQAIRLTA